MAKHKRERGGAKAAPHGQERGREPEVAAPEAEAVAEPVARDPKVEALLGSQDLVARAMKHADSPELMRELQELSPDEAAMFVLLVEKQLHKRRLELMGYGLALLGFLCGMLFALYLYAGREPGEFVGWAFLIPFLVAGSVLLVFGRLARRS